MQLNIYFLNKSVKACVSMINVDGAPHSRELQYSNQV